MGLALDAKGKTMLYDADGDVVDGSYNAGENKVSLLSSKMGATVTVYAIWQKAVTYKVKNLKANIKNGLVMLSGECDEPLTELTFEVEVDDSILFTNRGMEVLKREVPAAKAADGSLEFAVMSADSLTPGTYYVRVRQIKEDSAGLAVNSSYSWPVKLVVE